MSEGQNKKGFGGLSSLESNVEPIKVDSTTKQSTPESGLPKTEPKQPSSPKPPPVSVVTPREPDTPAIVFLKKYWVWIVIGLFVLYAAMNSGGSSNSGGGYSSSLTESAPPFGSGRTLSSSEIYYCLAENVRIEANQGTVNQYDSNSIARFNNVVADYNARCASYRYKQSAMSSATKALNDNRYLIESQGRGRM